MAFSRKVLGCDVQGWWVSADLQVHVRLVPHPTGRVDTTRSGNPILTRNKRIFPHTTIFLCKGSRLPYRNHLFPVVWISRKMGKMHFLDIPPESSRWNSTNPFQVRIDIHSETLILTQCFRVLRGKTIGSHGHGLPHKPTAWDTDAKRPARHAHDASRSPAMRRRVSGEAPWSDGALG